MGGQLSRTVADVPGESEQPPTISARRPQLRVARTIIDSLQQDIASGRLPLGTRLPNERDLARQFGVSQPTMREALRALEVMGLIDVRHGSGAYIAGDIRGFVASALQTVLQLERADIVDVLEVRALLGRRCAALAAKNATGSDIRDMESCLDAVDNALLGQDLHRMIEPTGSFQIAVAAAAHNPLLYALESYLVTLIIQLQIARQSHHGPDFWRNRVGGFTDDRRRLLEFIRAHDEAGAAEAMATYIESQHRVFAADHELADINLSDPRQLNEILAVGLDLTTYRR